MRTPIKIPELAADLRNLGQTASLIETALNDLLENRQLPTSSLPSMHAARRAAQSLMTHLGASATLAEAGQ